MGLVLVWGFWGGNVFFFFPPLLLKWKLWLKFSRIFISDVNTSKIKRQKKTWRLCLCCKQKRGRDNPYKAEKTVLPVFFLFCFLLQPKHFGIYKWWTSDSILQDGRKATWIHGVIKGESLTCLVEGFCWSSRKDTNCWNWSNLGHFTV